MRIVINITPRAGGDPKGRTANALENGLSRGELGSRVLCPG